MDLRDSLNRYYYDVTVSDLRQISRTGGVAGSNNSTVTNCRNTGAVTGTGTNFPGLHISVRNAPGTKCPRCWMHSEQADPETGLCPRCAAVVAAQQAE
mgnify:CR=1 FL=1